MEIKQAGEYREGDDFVRTVDFRVGSGPWGRFLPALDNDRPLPPTIDASWKPIVEIYHQITLTELREIDGDAKKQQAFVRRNLTPKLGATGIPILRLLVGECQTIEQPDVEYLSHLLPPPNLSIATTPLVYRYRMSRPNRADLTPRTVTLKPVDMSVYLPFVTAFVQGSASAGTRRFGITMPVNTSHRDVPALLLAYRDVSAPLAIVDANGNTTQQLSAQIRALVGTRGSSSYSLREKNGEAWAIYAFDSKPYRGRAEYVPALGLLQLDGPVNGFGKRHTLHIRMPNVPHKPPSPGRVVVPTELAFAKVGVPGATSALVSWWDRRAQEGMKGEVEALRHRGAFEREAMIGSARRIHGWAAAGVLSKRLSERRWIQEALAVARRENREGI